MTVSPPRIAIPEPTSIDEAYNRRSFPQYVSAIEAAGGMAVSIPLGESPSMQTRIVASCSAILLPGSPADVDPVRYGQEAVQECAATDPAREAADDLLLQHAFDKAKPVLGVCYGLQSLNVWRRGTLIQHLPGANAAKANTINHQPDRSVERAHAVLVTPGSLLSRVLQDAREGGELFVNSSHHQAIGRPGEELVVAAVSPVDGVIEALEGANPSRFVVGVQWHPERTYESSAASRALFSSLLEAADSWNGRAH
jgi:putative glutamine amidotransferase